MSRTIHHKSQKHRRCGFDYGGKYKFDKNYSGGYGSFSRKMAHKELRIEDKSTVRKELLMIDDKGGEMTNITKLDISKHLETIEEVKEFLQEAMKGNEQEFINALVASYRSEIVSGTEVLKPCPFCGSTILEMDRDSTEHDDKPYWFITCYECSCQGVVEQNRGDVIKVWNRRYQ